MMQKSNLLILDEPTNHLDLNSKEILENALIDYPGTLLFVSHDRYFINRVTTTVVELSTEGAQEYLGDYDYYVEKKNEMIERAEFEQQEQQENQAPVQNCSSEKLNYLEEKSAKVERQRTRKIEELEQNIVQFEEEIATLEDQLCLPEIYADYEKASEITTKSKHYKNNLMLVWQNGKNCIYKSINKKDVSSVGIFDEETSFLSSSHGQPLLHKQFDTRYRFSDKV